MSQLCASRTTRSQYRQALPVQTMNEQDRSWWLTWVSLEHFLCISNLQWMHLYPCRPRPHIRSPHRVHTALWKTKGTSLYPPQGGCFQSGFLKCRQKSKVNLRLSFHKRGENTTRNHQPQASSDASLLALSALSIRQTFCAGRRCFQALSLWQRGRHMQFRPDPDHQLLWGQPTDHKNTAVLKNTPHYHS